MLKPHAVSRDGDALGRRKAGQEEKPHVEMFSFTEICVFSSYPCLKCLAYFSL